MFSENVICVFHEDCNDGFTSAYLVWKKIPNATFYPAQYGKTPIPEVTKKDIVIIVDFSFPPEQLRELGDRAKQVFVLDHHESAVNKLKGFSHPNVELILDITKAGCMLTWEYLYAPNEREKGLPAIVKYSNDYDLWEFKYGEESEAFVRFMYSREKTFENWDLYGSVRSNDINVKRALEWGSTLIEDDEVKLQWHLDNSTRIMRVTEHNFEIPVCNIPAYILSKTMNRLAADHFFAIGYSEGRGGRKLRFNCSKESSARMNELAGLFGGGGHPRSAGAMVDLNLPWESIRSRIATYLNELED